ncbi:MAG TPA: zf-HC2 domain-containing protein [Terriglobales bacterium]|nr:zf-HC2 domain-containing protein [Terriglobales bacterium]
MSRDPHQQARELIACGQQDLSDSEQTWLRTHLDGCAACRDYAETAGQVVRSLRSVPVAADLGLVRTTQMRVRLHANQLRQKQERMWLVIMSCVIVGLSAAISTPFLWRGFEWLGEWARVSSPVWQVGFMVFWISPALAVSLIFLARGVHLADTNGTSRG